VTLVKCFKQNHPDVPIILYTGVVHVTAAVERVQKAEAHQYLLKGTVEELERAVQSAVASK